MTDAETIDLVGQLLSTSPWGIISVLGYLLARRAVKDVCKLMPKALDLVERATVVLEQGVDVRLHLTEEEHDE
jgi:hypothetical protein